MKVVSVFQTVDGKQFTSKEEAKKHEVEVESLNKLRQILTTSINSELVRRGNIDNVLKHILLESAEIKNVLQAYGRVMPKETAATAA